MQKNDMVLISVDDHVSEPPDMFEKVLDGKELETAPKLVVAEDGTVGVKILRVGPGYGNMRIIREGLTPQDKVVINGLMRARPGTKVTAEMGTIEDTSQTAAATE